MFSKVVVLINTPTCSLRVPVPLNSFQHLVWLIFKVLVILVGIWLYLMILICISLMTNVEYLFVCVWFFFFFYMYILLLKCLFKSSAQFYLVGLFVFLLLSFESSWCVLDASPLSDKWCAMIFFKSVDCLWVMSLINTTKLVSLYYSIGEYPFTSRFNFFIFLWLLWYINLFLPFYFSFSFFQFFLTFLFELFLSPHISLLVGIIAFC